MEEEIKTPKVKSFLHLKESQKSLLEGKYRITVDGEIKYVDNADVMIGAESLKELINRIKEEEFDYINIEAYGS